MKLILREPDCDGLADWFDARATRLVSATAAEFAELRPLDAIHLSTPRAVSGLEVGSITYSKRLLGTAELLRLSVASPGVSRRA